MERIHARQALVPEGWIHDVTILIGDDGRIDDLMQGAEPEGRIVDLALPAPANLHSHAFQRAMAGLTESRGPDPKDSFWTWRRLMYRFLDRLTPDQVEAIAAMVFMEMLEAGYGAVAEFHYLHHDHDGKCFSDLAEMSGRIVSAAETTGIGLTLLPVLYIHGGCDLRPLEGGQRRFGNGIDRFADLHDGCRKLVARGPADYALGLAPHSLRAVDTGALSAASEMAGDGVIHMHLAEQVAEVEEVEAILGARPVDWLLSNHDVDARWCLIHCTQMTDAETGALAQTGAVAGLCPITESSLGDGIFNGTDFVASGGRFGIGSDSNIHIALFEELCTLDYSQRLRDQSRAALATLERSTGRVLFETASHSSAQAAGRSSGRIAKGCWADILGVSTDNPYLCARVEDVALDSLIFTGHGRDCVTDVWSAGRHVVLDGCHIARDRIVHDFRQVMTDLTREAL